MNSPRYWVWATALLAAVATALAATKPVPAAKVRLAIRDVGAPKYAAREAASKQLIKFAESDHQMVLTECVQVYRTTTDPEIKWRLETVMAKVVDKYLFRVPRGFLGVRLQSVMVGEGGRVVINGAVMPPGGIWVGGVIENSAAEKAGLQLNDFLLRVDGRELQGARVGDFIEHIQSKRPGTHVNLTVLRASATNEIEATLGELPDTERSRIYSEENARVFFQHWLREQLSEGGDQPAEGK